MKNLKRSLFTSVVSLILCFVMLIGTTFAWFTDVATSANNIITTGNLDVSMHWSTNNEEWNNAEGLGAKPVFNYDKWEPGYTEVRYIKVKNEGSLSFKHLMYIHPTGVVGALADVIDVSYDIVTGNDGFTAPTAMHKMGSLRKLGTLSQVISDDVAIPGGVLLPSGKTSDGCYSGEVVICVAFHMQETAGNEYMGQSIGDSFGITLHATQYDYESDSFGTDYDTNAEWPERPINASVSRALGSGDVLLGALTNEVSLVKGSISATIPADVKVEDGATSLNLTVNSTEADGNLSLNDGESALGFNVHINGVSTANTKPMIVNLGAVLPAGIDATELKLYHTENGTPVQMTRVASTADFAIHNQYVYDPVTGEVSIYVASFSIFSAVKTSADVWDGTSVATGFASGSGTQTSPYLINTAAQLAFFRNQVDSGVTYENQFVKLNKDIDLAGHSFDPIGYGYTYNNDSDTAFMGTFDGGNHTIYGLYQNGWELGYSYSTAGGGLFASIENATIKNLVMDGANIVMECVDMGIVVGYAQGNCHFENIVITNSKIANYNRATGAVVGEVCYGSYGTDTSNDYSHTFKNIVVDSNVVVSSLWGSFDTLIGGVIGGKWGDATVHMDTVTVAAELDVFSDVTSAYQWYAYRRAGMLIGYTEQESPKTATYAKADFLTCVNVNVYYGDWVNYTYCEFEHTNNPGYRYPWVRVQAGLNTEAYSNPRYGNPTDFAGNKVTNNTHTHADGEGCQVSIPFNQLYGGGQGVYGETEHTGVKITKGLTKTVYFKNNWLWSDVTVYYWYSHSTTEGGNTVTHTWNNIDFPGKSIDPCENDGTYDYYQIEIPSYATGFIVSGIKNDGSDDRDQSPDILVSDVEENEMFYMHFDNGNQVKSEDFAEYCAGFKTVYLKPSASWKNSNTRFAAYAWTGSGTSKKEVWCSMKSIGNNLYSCWIPKDYGSVIFCGMKSNPENNWDNKNVQTTDITGVTDGYTCTITDKLYLAPNDNWKQSNARFAAYFFGNGEKWVNMTYNKDLGVYEVSIPTDKTYPQVIFCRMNPNASANNWDNKWNQTGDLTIPTNGNNLFTVPNIAWDNSTESWSVQSKVTP